MLEDIRFLAARYASQQHQIIQHADSAALRQHIADTFIRCLPKQIVIPSMVERCYMAIQALPDTDDPMHTSAVHAWAGRYLLEVPATTDSLLLRLHKAAKRFLPPEKPSTRDALRLVSLFALYEPKLLHSHEAIAFVGWRLGLKDGLPRSCEEISVFMHKPLLYIHELESAVLTCLSTQTYGGYHA